MKINGNEIRPGNILIHKGELWRAVRVQHVKPGKGGAFAQVELRSLTESTKLNERFRSSETIERARLEQATYQFLYANGDMLTLMDTNTYEQIEVPSSILGERTAFLQDGMDVKVESHDGQVVGVALPDHATLEISEAEPVVKGQTATASYKPARLTNGLRVMVPPFVAVGEKIVVDTNDMSYVRRAD